MINPLNAIARIIVGVHSTKASIKLKDAWFKFGMSIFGSAFVSFWGTMGATGGVMVASDYDPILALVTAFFAGSFSMAGTILALWKRSSLTKGIPIMAPSIVEEKVLEESYTYTEPK